MSKESLDALTVLINKALTVAELILRVSGLLSPLSLSLSLSLSLLSAPFSPPSPRPQLMSGLSVYASIEIILLEITLPFLPWNTIHLYLHM